MICVILVAGHGYVLEEEIKVWSDFHFVFVEDSLTMLTLIALSLACTVTATTK
jgi:hypothetical protein